MRSRSAAAPKPVRHRSSGLQTRAEIVAAAERFFAERGFEATRLDDIAAEVGIRRAAIFYHFGDKQELYAAVLDEVFRDWSLPSGGSAAERLAGVPIPAGSAVMPMLGAATGTRLDNRIPIASTSSARPSPTSRSATASTSASGCTSPGSRWASR